MANFLTFMAELTEIDAYTTLAVGLLGHTLGQIHSHSTTHNYIRVTFPGEESSPLFINVHS